MIRKSLAQGVLILSVLGASADSFAKGGTCPGGELQLIKPGGEACGLAPLRHTDVEADITGWVGKVRVRQVFYNPLDQKIEAIYVFPLPENAAVDDMVMTIGDRRVVGQIKPRDEARRAYEAARATGHVAGLLDQERPNIFTQSVANIEPGVEVTIEISFVETLGYEDGEFEFVFPMVVGPRYIPGGGSAPAPMMTGQPTPQVPDGNRITPPVTPPGTRAGHDISLTVRIDAGAEIAEVASELHAVDVDRDGPGRAVVRLAKRSEIPNRDFVLHYRTAREGIGDSFFTHTDARGTFFTLLLEPPRRVTPETVVPREIIFVLDTSGSMSGFPIEKAKQVMTRAVDAMRSGDTFNIITFSGDTHILWDRPRPNDERNRNEAKAFLASRNGAGGTEMMKAINAALVQARGEWGRPIDGDRDTCRRRPMRVVCFMTDGYVGNNMAIIDAIRTNAATTRVFSFGIGNSVNRFLLDGMAKAGRGEVEYVSLSDEAEKAVGRFCERIAAPVLADIELDWGSLNVSDVHPAHVNDLFSVKPVMVQGRIKGDVTGAIALRGRTGSGSFVRTIQISPSGKTSNRDALASLWARAKVDDLMLTDYAGLQQGTTSPQLRDAITTLGVDYRLLTQFTSFVAVEETRVTVGGQPTTIRVPVEMPDGVSYDGVFGRRDQVALAGQVAKSTFTSVESPMVAPEAERKLSPPPPASSPANENAFGDVRQEVGASDEPKREKDGSKLANELVDLADRVTKEGADGNLKVGKLRIDRYKVDIRVYLRDTSQATLDALKSAGFDFTEFRKDTPMIIGNIDVRKLDDLTRLDVVLRIAPAVD